MKVKEYWERRKKLEIEFFNNLERLRNNLNSQFEDISDFEEICLKWFKYHFSEYYEVEI